ncbi:unnamed protein product [Soboliphyme baturini]|uniref:DEP domain-containing protein n=1 Tax=Soboliphyme baturini TaxID=241478 RepID=A0A183IZE0_9BILA|nr:unnamed protein product [Soboliphyme baturini]
MFLFKCCSGGWKTKKAKSVVGETTDACPLKEEEQVKCGLSMKSGTNAPESCDANSFKHLAHPSHISPNPSLNIPFIDEFNDAPVLVQIAEKKFQHATPRRSIMLPPFSSSKQYDIESLPPVALRRPSLTSTGTPPAETIKLQRNNRRTSSSSVNSEDFKAVIDKALENEQEVSCLKKLLSEKFSGKSYCVSKLSGATEDNVNKLKPLKSLEPTYDNMDSVLHLESVFSDGLDSGVETDISWRSSRYGSTKCMHHLGSQSIAPSRPSSVLDVSNTSATEIRWPSCLEPSYRLELASYDFHITNYDEDFACMNMIDWACKLISSMKSPLINDEYLMNLIHMMLYDCTMFHRH